MLSAMSCTRPINVSCVIPEECGVISTFDRSLNGYARGAARRGAAVVAGVGVPDIDGGAA